MPADTTPAKLSALLDKAADTIGKLAGNERVAPGTLAELIAELQATASALVVGAVAESDTIALTWSVDDVLTVRENLTRDEAQQVLELVHHRHDAAIGVSWDTLEVIADELFPGNEQREPAEAEDSKKDS